MPKRRSRAGKRQRVEQAAVEPQRLDPSVTPPAPIPTMQQAGVATAPPIVPSPTLADAMGAVIEQSARRVAEDQAPPTRPSVPSGWLAGALGSWLVVAWLLVATPGVARGPADRPWQPIAAEREASLRYGLWLAHDRVEGFRRDHGRLPSFLAEAGVADTTLTLVVEGEREYTIEGRDGPLRLGLGSAMAADSFLGSSLQRLRGE